MRILAGGAAYGMVGFGALVLAAFLVGLSNFGVERLDTISGDLLDRHQGVMIGFFVTVVLAPVCEEFIFRGFLYGALRTKLGSVSAALISSAIFAALHGYSAAGFCVVFLYGLIFVRLYQRSGSLWPGIVAHGAFNLMLTLQLVGWFSLH